jgi:hypothetical protein
MTDWCDCPDRPQFATGPLTLLDHGPDCAFPAGPCGTPAHRMSLHETCGRPVEMLYCGCTGGEYGYSFDPERGWWVHFRCGWPTRLWFEAAGRPAPERLRGIRPTTYHEFQVVSRSPRAAYGRLDERGRTLNSTYAGGWVRD